MIGLAIGVFAFMMDPGSGFGCCILIFLPPIAAGIGFMLSSEKKVAVLDMKRGNSKISVELSKSDIKKLISSKKKSKKKKKGETKTPK